MARFLTLHLEWLTGQHPAVELADELEVLVAELRQTIDPEPDQLRTHIGQCIVDNCPGTISVPAPRGAGAGRSSITCSSGHSWEVCEWLSLRKLMERQRKGVHA
ncbi:hypothetical protein [Streptomyces sp. MZ04]|uniref:hypothetical protein n=1 Tax=Streptomyces sp. MZ04 TaxID=2559236 RepID=UPI001FD7BBAD|nr:hypothetical protein [Streptomyces sp. MZ04]